ncbi:juvenile hormone acid methyltransferase isoform 2-T2 [Cochliomyia hominivorax]
MNQACLYHRANQVQRHDAEEIIKEYAKTLQWRLDGTDALLDVGSGSGDVLMDFIYTIMPENFERIVGSDISPKMMSYAKNCYHTQEKCDFRVLDIETDKDIPNDMREQFDHVTSFYCLHWIQNQSKSSKWSPYMKDVDQFISPLHYSSDPKLEFSLMLKEAGFSDIQVELRNKLYVYEGLEIFKDNVKAVCPFLDRMPLSLHDTFMDDFINTVTNLDLKQNLHSNELDYKFNSPYKLLIAYAKKSPSNTSVNISDMIGPSKLAKGFN